MRSLHARKFQLELPREHGASVAFAIASLFCVALSPTGALSILSLASMAGIMLSLNRPLQLAFFAITGAIVLSCLAHSYVVACPVVMMAAGACAMHACRRMDFGLKQTIGMAAVAIFPLLSAIILSSFNGAVLVRSLLFVACTLLSTAVVQMVTKSGAMNPRYSIFGALTFFVLAATLAPSPIKLSLLAVPFLLQIVWLSFDKKPSFKVLGIAQTICLSICAAILVT